MRTAVMHHAVAYWEQMEEVAAKYGMSLEPLKVAIESVDVEQLCSCAMESWMAHDMKAMMECGMQFASAAMVVFKTLMGHPPSTTTTGAWSTHTSFEDLLG